MAAQELSTEAFHWIIGILRERNIPFQITGGLAAKIYGSPRDLNDIDIEIPDERINELKSDVEQYIEYGPAHWLDERWDLQLLMLNYKGQLIDISGSDRICICDARTGVWKECPSDLSTAELHQIFGLNVPIVNREFLVMYKQMLKGEHQTIDIDAIQKSLSRIQ